MRVLKPLFVGLASVLVAFAPATAQETRPVPINEVSPPKQLPQLAYQNAEGKRVPVDFASSKLTLLHFWATWCVPCVTELPEIDALTAKYQGKGLTVLPLALDGANTQRVVDYYKKINIVNLPPNADPKSGMLRALNGMGVPLSVFVNAKGEEIGRSSGVVEWNDKETVAFIEKYLGRK